MRIALVYPVTTSMVAGEYLRALALFVLAGLSDGVDGYLAKRFHWTSELGKVLDPVADKLLLVTLFVAATWLGLVPWWLTAAVVARDVFIGAGALIFYLWLGPLRGRPTVYSKINTALQLLYLFAVMLNAALSLPPHEVLEALAVLVLGSVLVSGGDYLTRFTHRALVRLEG
jgi:cardiolipin synthase (CMP-forming)